MSIQAEVVNYLQNYTAEAVFSDTALSFYGPAWEIGLFFGLIPIKGKTKELLRIEYDNIAEVKVGKNNRPFNKKDACLIRLKNGGPAIIEVTFIPFEAGRAMLFDKVEDRFV